MLQIVSETKGDRMRESFEKNKKGIADDGK